jgi:hypothetical protein
MLVFAQRVAFAFVSCGGKVVDSRYLDVLFMAGLWCLVNLAINYPSLWRSLTITINFLVMAAPVGDTSSTVSIKT